MAQEERTVAPEEGVVDRRGGPTQWVPLAVISVLASAVGVAIGLLLDWFPAAASTQAGPIDTLWDVLLIAEQQEKRA